MSTEGAKCAQFIKHAEMTAQTKSLPVAVECVNASTHEKCIEKIKSGDADLVTLDGGDIYAAGTLPILASMIGSEAESRTNDFMPNVMPFTASKLPYVLNYVIKCFKISTCRKLNILVKPFCCHF